MTANPSRPWWTLLVVVVAVGVLDLHARPPVRAEQPAPLDRALLDRYCVTCHNERLLTGGLALDTVDLDDTAAHAEVLEKVVRKLRAGQMPPVGRPRPAPAVSAAFAMALETALDHASSAALNPGRLPVHRLNRLEYVTAVRDLLAIEVDPDLLPIDNAGVGFDNNADVLTVTPALMSRYLSAATKVSRLAVGDPAIGPGTQIYRAPEFADQSVRAGDDLPFGTHGGLAARHAFPLDGEYMFKLGLQRASIGNTIRGIDDEHEIQVRIDHRLVERFSIGGLYPGHDVGLVNGIRDDDLEARALHAYRTTADDALELRIPVGAGMHLVTVAFTDRAPAVSELVPLRPSSRQRRIFTDDAGDPSIETLSIAGPYNATRPDNIPSRQRIFVCRPASPGEEESCARTILRTLTERAYRRPATAADLDELLGLYIAGRRDGDFDAGIQLALEGLLASPAFLFSIELDPVDSRPGMVYPLTHLELASRLSRFLWKSLPDDPLRTAAGRALDDPAVLVAETGRMLADPMATRWIDDFAEQWLTVRNIQAHQPNHDLFPHFDDTLRAAMATETRLFFRSQVREDRSVLDLLRADYTFLNEPLARHYGVPNVYGSHFRRVTVTDPARSGLLGQASILTVTSYANRTSIVLRGKWVLETLLGAPPPPPPPDVPDLEDNVRGQAPKSLRERMEQHRANPICASCHATMDPVGFALENFDATGHWRDTDAGAAIDVTTTLPGGETIDGPAGLRQYVLDRRAEFLRTVAEKLLSYALGRSLEYYDAPAVRQILREAARDDYRWSALVQGVVRSAPFRMRRVADPSPASIAAARRP
jgi:hypothetical protein